MRELGIRSPSAKVGGLVYFGRMLDKIRAHEKNDLPSDYQANLGHGFDEFCTKFLHVQYHDVVRRVKDGGGDEEILWWCFDKGHRPSENEICVWNEFMRKRGWNDEITETLKRR
jgi:gluconokinase